MEKLAPHDRPNIFLGGPRNLFVCQLFLISVAATELLLLAENEFSRSGSIETLHWSALFLATLGLIATIFDRIFSDKITIAIIAGLFLYQLHFILVVLPNLVQNQHIAYRAWYLTPLLVTYLCFALAIANAIFSVFRRRRD